jgi:hypothetical protein
VSLQVKEGLIELRKIPTESNVADMLTKLIVGKAFTIKAMHLLGEMGINLDDPYLHQEDLTYEQE